MAIVQATGEYTNRPRDELAATGASLLRHPMGTFSAFDTAAKLQHTKERLYVLCQLSGWGLFLVIQFSFARAAALVNPPQLGHNQMLEAASMVMVVLLGLVLTHYARPLITRWGWKQLGWRSLSPRIVLMAAILSLLWMAAGFGYSYGVLQLPWAYKSNPAIVVIASWLNGMGLMFGWLCIYFFYHIYEQLQRLQVEQLRLVANIKEAELRALKAQVNPHFLFNSLNSLRALIEEDAPRAREAVTRLASMLRYSLQSGQLETVTLEEELRTVEDYLALEQIRHENRLRVSWQIAAAARTQIVPPMLVQTLVENAVKYGVSIRREGGEVMISAQIEKQNLIISVINPGELTAPSNAASALAGSSTGVGLRNASERLKFLYGDRATLRLFSAPAGCVSAVVSIPLPGSSA